jgi:hypothetical protein
MSSRLAITLAVLLFVLLILNVRQEHLNEDHAKESITHWKQERDVVTTNLTWIANRTTVIWHVSWTWL